VTHTPTDEISVTVTSSVASALLARAGFTQDARGRWTARDDAERWTWAKDEALRWALVTLAADEEPTEGSAA
jgi:hypothetical protein